MPNFDSSFPFSAFITNLGKYNEGDLVGEWVKFPTTPEVLQEVFHRIGIGQKDDFGQPYEEWFITDYDCYVDGLYDKLGEYANLDELNYLASKIEDMNQWDYERFQAAMEVGEHSSSVQEIINLTENLDCYDVYPDIHDHDDLGRYYINELDAMQVPEHLIDYIDYEAYGRDVAINEGGEFTSFGYVRDTGNRFVEFYDGDRDNIPEEYQVTSVPGDAELTESEQVEWAMDLAFDLDEFFRQHDPHYAAEHPDAHAQKEALTEDLLQGRIATIEGRLTDLAQTANDVLPMRLEKFKDAMGYDEFLDIDPDAIRQALENPDKSRMDEMLAFAEQAEQEYAAQAEVFVQTPADIMEQAQAIQEESAKEDSFSIYQLKRGDETLDYCFESLASIHRNGLSVDPTNYELVYTAPLTAHDDLERIYTRFNMDRPADFTGHSLSVSDIVVLHQNGMDTAHYCDSVGFSQVPEFLRLSPDALMTGEMVQTPRGSFYVTAMSQEQMEAAGYGLHHQSEDGKYFIMGNGTRAFAIASEQVQEKDNPLRTAEMTIEDDYGMIDGVINNGRRDEPQARASIRDRLEDAKRASAEHSPANRKRLGRDGQTLDDL